MDDLFNRAFLVYAGLSLLDGSITYNALNIDSFQELNPALKWLTPLQIVLVKALLLIPAYFLYRRLHKRNEYLSINTIKGIIVFLLCVVSWNIGNLVMYYVNTSP